MIYRLSNTIQEYTWGDLHSISALLGVPNDARKHQAELWMGAHPKSPSFIFRNGEKESLDKFISRSPLSTLGEYTRKRFGKLPFLFKVLAAGEPLSIQVHPNLEQAKNGFAFENNQNIALDAFNRNYKDDNHKPEIICALTTFHAMNGFRPINKIISYLELIPVDFFKEKILILKENEPSIGLKLFFEAIMCSDEKTKKDLISSVCLVAQKNKDIAFEWVLKLKDKYPDDIGALCPLFLNIITLQPGEAMFLEAGRLHSYLQGLGIELMANSDNVLRGGLTPKFMDINELLKILKFEPTEIKILKPKGFLPEKFFPDFVEEFSLSTIDITGQTEYELEQNKKPSIILCTEGHGNCFNGEEIINIEKGQSFFIPADQPAVKITGVCRIYRATVGS